MVKRIVKVTLPRVQTDFMKAKFTTRDRSWSQEVEVTAPLTQFMGGKFERFLEPVTDGNKIISMKPAESKAYYGDLPPEMND